jgi:ATP synthase protein I
MPETPDQETNRKSGLAYAAAINLFASVIALSGVGWVVDRWLGTKPWFLAAGVVLGSIVGLYQFIRISSKTL